MCLVQNQPSLNILIEKIKQLRDQKTGCPWMLQQTLDSIVPHTIEEVYEVADAIEKNNMQELKYELGDLLYSVLIYADMAEESGFFDLNDIIQGLEEKIIRRHPHLYDDNRPEKQPNIEALEKNWAEIKKKESKNQSILTEMPLNLPALSFAQKMQKKVASLGFDWKHINDVIDKIQEEIKEYETARAGQSTEHIQEELGDLLFSVVNLIRLNNFDAEKTLRLSNQKFLKRFQSLENHVQLLNKKVSDLSLDELEAIWQLIKKQ